jgi:hypothetical protein
VAITNLALRAWMAGNEGVRTVRGSQIERLAARGGTRPPTRSRRGLRLLDVYIQAVGETEVGKGLLQILLK